MGDLAHDRPNVNDPSDIFSVRESRNSIPQITNIPRTKEEIRKQRALRALLSISGLAVAVFAVWLGVHLHRRAAIDDARLEVERTGRPSSLDDVLSRLASPSDPGDVALAARLHATAALEGIEGHRELAARLLEHHDPGGEGASDHRIAQTYLALAEGDANAAATHASGLVMAGPRAAEAGYARALAAYAIGNIEMALGTARALASALADAPRHDALRAVIEARAGQTPSLSGDAIPVLIAQSRVRWDAGHERDGIAESLRGLVQAPDVTPRERMWARLLVARALTERGDAEEALGAIVAIGSEPPPPGDEAFRVQLAEAWLALGRSDEAQAIMSALPVGVSVDAGRRAQVIAELHLSRGELDLAEQLAANAPSTPRTMLLRARIEERRGHVELATQLYEEAARGAAEHVAATVELASLLTRSERATEAIALVSPLLETRPTHPIIAATAAGAYGATNDHARGFAILERALSEHPRDPALLATKARLHLSTSQWQEALDALRLAIDVSPGDARLHTERGQAARHLGQLDEARAAFEAAITIDARQVEALRALLAVQLETRDFDGMPATFAKIDEASASSLEVEQTRARYFVETSAGAAGIDLVRRARREARRDKVLAYFLARLFLQAERHYDAISSFEEALPPEGLSERRDVFLFRVLAFARARRGSTVEHLAEQLRQGAVSNPFTPEEEARLLVAEAWAARHDDAFGRAMPLLRRALNLHPNDAEALHLLGVIDELQGRDPTARLRAAMSATPPSIEAMGRLALQGDMDEEHCAWGQRYLRVAPEGGIASAVRDRVRSSCARP